jgi:hypothetical protein
MESKEVKEKGKKINRQVGKKNKESNKKVSKIYAGSISVLIDSKLNRH